MSILTYKLISLSFFQRLNHLNLRSYGNQKLTKLGGNLVHFFVVSLIHLALLPIHLQLIILLIHLVTFILIISNITNRWI